MTLRTVLAFCLWLHAAILCGAEIGIGDAREDVLRQLGKPSSIAKRGGHEIFLYPKGGRIEFVDGKVTDVKGPLPTPTVAPPPSQTPEPAARSQTPARETPKETPANALVEPASNTAPQPAVQSHGEYNPAVVANELATHVEKMDTGWGAAPSREEIHSPLDSLPTFLTGLFLRFVFTVAALKLAFKYWEMDAFWKGIFLIAAIDLALHAIFELLGPVTGGFTTMVAVENGVPGLVLIYTINRFCFNKRIQNAVLTAAAVKLVVTLCYIAAGVTMLNSIYG